MGHGNMSNIDIIPYDANRQNSKSMMTNIVGYSFHHVPPNHFSG